MDKITLLEIRSSCFGLRSGLYVECRVESGKVVQVGRIFEATNWELDCFISDRLGMCWKYCFKRIEGSWVITYEKCASESWTWGYLEWLVLLLLVGAALWRILS